MAFLTTGAALHSLEALAHSAAISPKHSRSFSKHTRFLYSCLKQQSLLLLKSLLRHGLYLQDGTAGFPTGFSPEHAHLFAAYA